MKETLLNLLDDIRERANGLTLLVAVPLIVMSYHVYQFFETDPFIVRIGLAISFDILIVVLFFLINDDLIKKNKQAIRTCWICISVLIGFQLYVNTWVYWGDVSAVRALVSGAIFPLLVAPISYIASLRKSEEMKVEKRQRQRTHKAALPKIKNVEPAPDQIWKDQNVPRELVEASASIEPFRGARNWRSVKRWHKNRES